MIRINLLKPGRAPAPKTSPEAVTARKQPAEAADSHWISRGEVWTGAALLAMGGAVLAYLISLPRAPGPAGARTAGAVRVGSQAPAPDLATPLEQKPPTTVSASSPEAAAATLPKPVAAVREPREPASPAPAASNAIAASKPPAPPADVPASRPSVRGFEVSGIAARREEGNLVVAIEVGAGVKYQTREMREPSRLVLDLADCHLVMPAPLHTQAVTSPLIARVRASQYQVEPAVCRIVLDAASLPHYEVRPAANGLEIHIADGGR